MQVIKDQIGNTTIFIQTVDGYFEIVGDEPGGRATKPTGIKEGATAAYAVLKEIIKDIAQDVGSELDRLTPEGRPQEVEMEFSLGVSSQLGPIWLCGKGESAVKVKLIWKLGQDAEVT